MPIMRCTLAEASMTPRRTSAPPIEASTGIVPRITPISSSDAALSRKWKNWAVEAPHTSSVPEPGTSLNSTISRSASGNGNGSMTTCLSAA